MKQIKSIYMLKAICAFFVICIHTLFCGRFLIVPFIRCAVPCFFMISGYFLYYGNENFIHNGLRQIGKLFKIAVVANIVYLILALLLGNTDILAGWTFNKVLSLVFSGNVISQHLWFLNAMIYSLATMIIVKKVSPLKTLTPTVTAILILLMSSILLYGIACERYFPIFHAKKFISYFWETITSLPFICAGALIRHYESHIMSIGNRILFFLFALFSVISFGEYFYQSLNTSLIIAGSAMNFATIPLSATIFILCIRNKEIALHSTLVNIGKNDSLYIYLYHMAIIYILWNIASGMMLSEPIYLPYLVFAITLLISKVIHKIKRNE